MKLISPHSEPFNLINLNNYVQVTQRVRYLNFTPLPFASHLRSTLINFCMNAHYKSFNIEMYNNNEDQHTIIINSLSFSLSDALNAFPILCAF